MSREAIPQATTPLPFQNLQSLQLDDRTAINKFTAQKFISYILSPYFISYLGAYILGPILLFIIYPLIFQEPVPYGTPNFGYLFFIFILIASGLLLVVLSLYYGQRNSVSFLQPSILSKHQILFSIITFTGLSLSSYYFITYAFKIFYGNQSIIPPETASLYSITGQMQIFVTLSTHFPPQYRFLILLGVLLQYVGMAFVYRGLATRALDQWGVKAAGIILLPALAETILFNFNLFFQSDIIYASYLLLIWFAWSMFGGIIYWYTRSLRPVLVYTLLLHFFLPNDPLQLIVYYNFPEWLGQYDLVKAPVTFVDKVAMFNQNLSLFIMVISFFLPFLNLHLAGKFFTELYQSFKTQGKGILIVLIMVLTLEIIFYAVFQVIGGDVAGFIFGLIIALVLVSLAFRAIAVFLPSPSPEQIFYYSMAKDMPSKNEIPLDPKKDIETLEKPVSLKEKPLVLSISLVLLELYFYSFTNAYFTTYTIIQTKNTMTISLFFLHNYIIPLGFLAFIGYSFASLLYYQPFFYSAWQGYAETFAWVFTALLMFSFMVWTSLGVSHIRAIAFLPFFLKIMLKPDTRELPQKIQDGLTHANRYRTILFIKRNYSRIPEVEKAVLALRSHPNRLISGITNAISCLLTPLKTKQLSSQIKTMNNNEKYGILLCMGFKSSRDKSLSQLLVSLLKDSDYALAYVTLWALKNVGVKDHIPRIERFMWRVTNPELQDYCRITIKAIDPDYPLLSDIQEDLDLS